MDSQGNGPARPGSLGLIAGVLRAVAANPDLRRVQLAFAGFNAAEWAVWIAMLVYAYEQGGATAAGLVALAQLVPAGIYAPFAAALADRHPAGRVLKFGYVAQAAAMGATAVALLAGAPSLIAYAMAAAAASATCITRPAQAVLLPGLVRGVDELTATNVVSGWTESISLLVAPAAAGGLLALGGPELVFAVFAGVALGSAALVAPLRGPPAPPAPDEEEGALKQAAAGLRLAAEDPAARTLVILLGTQFLLIGALDVLFVVVAVEVLDLGGSGAGYLNAAFGAGGVLGIVATVRLVGRPRLSPPIVAAALAWSAALVGIGLWHQVGPVFVLFAVAGAARGLLDVAGRSLLQRTARTDVLARIFGLLETLDAIGLAVGSLLAPALVALLGPEHAIAGLAAVLPIVLLLSRGELARLEERADVPVVEVALLRSVPIFTSLGAPSLEGLARRLTPVELGPGDVIIREGTPGERYYVIADGELRVTQGSETLGIARRGDGVGEISLLADVPCTATVTAVGDARVFALEGDEFVEVVTGHPRSSHAADAIMRERLEGDARRRG